MTFAPCSCASRTYADAAWLSVGWMTRTFAPCASTSSTCAICFALSLSAASVTMRMPSSLRARLEVLDVLLVALLLQRRQQERDLRARRAGLHAGNARATSSARAMDESRALAFRDYVDEHGGEEDRGRCR